MKRIICIKETLLHITFVTVIFLMASCNNNQKTEDTKEVAEEHNEAKFDKNEEKDAQFLVNAAEINLEEIQLGQLAQQKGRTTHVKELGRMMEDAHSKLQNGLSALAKSKMITIPTSPTADALDAYEKLNEKSENDFDEAYADMMVKGHKDAIETFEKASTDCDDADIRNWAIASLPDLRMHLDHSIDCQKKLEKL